MNAPRKHVSSWLIAVVVAVVVIVGGAIAVAVQRSQQNDDAPVTTVAAGTEACAAIADPQNARLTPGDWRRIGHWTQTEMETYVLTHCPELIDRVRS